MHFPKFWAKGLAREEGQTAESWGWSDNSSEDAHKRAEESARKVARRFASTGKTDHRRYYGDRPFREEILQAINCSKGSATALVTRNSYGCQVLNTAGLMFIDVDLADERDDPLGRNSAPPKDVDVIVSRAREWAERNPGWGWRVYRTKAGLRFAATHKFFEPQEAVTNTLFDILTADPLYRKLCQNQKCFRARLTPKPWRCGVWGLSVPWPWTHPNVEKRFRAWEKKYLKVSTDFSTCELLATVGNPDLHSDIAPILRLHDEKTRIGSGLPLA
jgi:hypothetical protein